MIYFQPALLTEMAHLVAELAGVSLEVAEKALAEHKEVWLAVDALLLRPTTAGDKYIPAKPKIDTGLTPEQEEMCKRGRWLQDQVNVVFSVAHSKIRTQPGSVPETSPSENLPVVLPLAESSVPAQTSESQPDSREQTAQPAQQSETPL